MSEPVCVCVKAAGLPWQSRGLDSVLPRQEMRVRSLVGELRSYMLCGQKKKNEEGIYRCEQHMQAAHPGLLECECSEEGIYTGGRSVIRWQSK